MTEFSQKCQFYLSESGSNVYQIAKSANLDRTTVQRMLTGKRLPSQEFVSTFCDHLRINSIERKDLIESYKIEKIGKPTYTNRKYVQKLIEHISQTQNQPEYYMTLEASILPTDKIILGVLKEVFEQENSDEILTNIPASHNYFYHALTEMMIRYQKCVSVKHTFSMYPNPLSIPYPSVNLEKLYYIVPFLFSNYKNYSPSYYYSRNLDSDYSTQLFPYYIITPYKVALFSADLKHSNILTDANSIKLYQRAFQNIQKNTHPLVLRISEPLEALDYYKKSLLKHGVPTHSLEPQPCIFSLLTSIEQLDYLCSDSMPQKAALVEQSSAFFEKFFTLHESFKNICSLDAYRDLVENGQLYGAFTIFADTLPVEERKRINRHFEQSYAESNNYYVMNHTFEIPKHLQIELYNNNQMYILSTREKHFYFLGFNESSICDAFYDFIESLCDSEFVIPREEMQNILHDYAFKNTPPRVYNLPMADYNIG